MASLDALAATIQNLSPEDRAQLAAMLLGQADGANVNPATPDAAERP